MILKPFQICINKHVSFETTIFIIIICVVICCVECGCIAHVCCVSLRSNSRSFDHYLLFHLWFFLMMSLHSVCFVIIIFTWVAGLSVHIFYSIFDGVMLPKNAEHNVSAASEKIQHSTKSECILTIEILAFHSNGTQHTTSIIITIIFDPPQVFMNYSYMVKRMAWVYV